MAFFKTTNISDKSIEYMDYIKEHIVNVNQAFEIYGAELSRRLNISYDELKDNIEVHDKSKFDQLEFSGYRQYFYPSSNEAKNELQFKYAWLSHLRNNPHHPEYWTYVDDNNKQVILTMPNIYIAEMLLDWTAMSIKFKNSVVEYYTKNRDVKPLSENTKKVIDSVIDIFN